MSSPNACQTYCEPLNRNLKARFTRKLKKYKCSKKDKSTKVKNSIRTRMRAFFYPRSYPLSNTKCEQKSRAYSQAQLQKLNDQYTFPWQKCVRRYKCF